MEEIHIHIDDAEQIINLTVIDSSPDINIEVIDATEVIDLVIDDSTPGPKGDPGDPGPGVPPGGTTGQVPKKQSNADHDVAWEDEAGGVSAFDELSDTPVNKIGSAGKFAKVNPAEDGIIYVFVDWTDLQNVPLAFSPSVHTHSISDVTGLQTALDDKADDSHTHVIGDVAGLQTALDDKANDSHTHVIGDVTGLQPALDAKAEDSHTHDAADIVSGNLNVNRMPDMYKVPADSNSSFLEGFQAPSNGSTSANIIHTGTLGARFEIDLSLAPSSADISLAGAPINSEIHEYPGGNVTVASMHTFAASDRGRYRYWAELDGAIWKLYIVKLFEEAPAGTPAKRAIRACSITTGTSIKNVDVDLEWADSVHTDSIYAVGGTNNEEITINQDGWQDFEVRVHADGDERLTLLIKLWKWNGATWDLIDETQGYTSRGTSPHVSGANILTTPLNVASGDKFKATAQAIVASTKTGTLISATTRLYIKQSDGIGEKGDPGEFDAGTWTLLSYSNNFGTSSGGRDLQYKVGDDGWVEIRGHIQRNSGSSLIFCTLPVEARPDDLVFKHSIDISGAGAVSNAVRITSAGVMSFLGTYSGTARSVEFGFDINPSA